jgi:hypothetical protein
MPLDPNSRAYDPTYQPTKTLEQLVAEHPHNQFLADRPAELREAIAGRRAEEAGDPRETDEHQT